MRYAVTTTRCLWPASVDARVFGMLALHAAANGMPSCAVITGHKPQPRRPLTS